MEHMHQLHHRAVAAARRNAPAPAPVLYNLLARDDAGLSLPTDLIPPILGQAPSSLIAPFLASVIPTINPLSGILPTIPHTDTSAPSKPTTGLSSNTDTPSTVGTHTPSPVLKTTSSPVSQGTDSTTLTTTTSSYSLPPQVPTVATQVVPPSPSTGALNNNNNVSASQTSGATTRSGTVAAGVVVGLVGACGMVVFLVFLVRRKLRKSHDDFDATDFRRSAVQMHDPPAHEDVVARGHNPRPPTMIERKMANSPAIPVATYGNMYNAPPAGYYNTSNSPYNQTMFAGGQRKTNGSPHTQVPFTGGQLMNPSVSVPPSPGSFATAGHSQSSNGVLVTPSAPYIMKPPRRTSRPATGNDPGAANGFTFPQRQGSRPSTAERQQEQDVITAQVPSGDYVELSRSSVSPFQAAPYEAISRKLATDVPRGLDDFDDFDAASVMAPSSLEYIDEAPPVPPKSPFEDPGYAAVEPSTGSADGAPPPVPSKSPFQDPVPEHETEIIQGSVRESYTSHQTLRTDTPELLDFPVPPSPALTLTSRHRVDSLPPTLPELNLDFDFQETQPPNAIKGKSAAPKYSSSPLAANNMAMGDEVEETGMPSQKNVSSVLSTAEATHKSRPDTVYDPADAYGGI